MNITDPLHLDAIRRFDAFQRSFDDTPADYSILDDNYILDITILADIRLDDFDRLRTIDLALNDELHNITLIIAYDNESLAIRHLTLIADTCYSDIPI